MKNSIDLEPRLRMIAGMIPACHFLCDIGTDHAYIPIYAAQQGLCRKIIAADIREGPLKIANENIRVHGLTDVIETRIGNGLDAVDFSELDVVLICGMGGLTITHMLETQKEKVQKCNRIIMQCMYADDMVRAYCYEQGLSIVDESICLDKGKLYTAMAIVPGGKPVMAHPAYNHGSKSLFEKRDPLIVRYLSQRIVRLERIRAGHKRAKETDYDKVKAMDDVINRLQSIKMEMEGVQYDNLR